MVVSERPAVTPSGGTQSVSPRLDFVDGLRGLAIFAVLLCHCWHLCGKYAITVGGLNILRPLEFGYLGVHLFLILSGFCLALPLARRDKNAPDDGAPLLPLQKGRFFRQRAMRILPPYYASILLVVLLALTLPHLYSALSLPPAAAAMPTGGSVAAHTLLLHNFFPPYVFDIVASYWSLGLEAQFYLCFPLLVWAARRWGVWPMVGGTLAITLLYRTVLWSVHPLSVRYGTPKELFDIGTGIGYTSLAPGRLLEFALGMAAAVLIARHAHRLIPRRMAAACVLLLASGIALTHFWGRFAPLTDMVLGGGFFFLLLTCASLPRVRRMMEWRPLVWLGFVSYSVYLVHEPFLHEAYALLAPLRLNGWQALLVFEFGLLPLLVAIGYGFHLLAERPLLRKRGGSCTPRSAVPVSSKANSWGTASSKLGIVGFQALRERVDATLPQRLLEFLGIVPDRAGAK